MQKFVSCRNVSMSYGGGQSALSARENLEIWFRARHVPEDDRRYLAETLGIEKILEREAGLLSSGMKKAVLFACAVAGHPPFVLLDEPFVHLDITDRLLILRNGRKIELASGQDLREKYGADAHDELGKLYLRIAADEEGRNSKKGGERQ